MDSSTPDPTSTDGPAPVNGSAASAGPVTDAGVDAESGVRLVLGAYTSAMDGIAPGLSAYRWNASDDEAVDLVAQEAVPLESPSWVEAHPSGKVVYAVSEGTPPLLHAVPLAADGSLGKPTSLPIDGAGPCHLALTADARHLVIANYGDGTVASFPLDPEGNPGEQVGRYGFNWTGPDLVRQDKSHSHQVVMDGDGFWVANLGGDVVHRLRLDEDGQFVSEVPPVELPAGTGPRHLVVSGEHMVVACELTAQVWLGRRDGDTYRQVALVPSSAREAAPERRTYPSGIGVFRTGDLTQVLVANRGCDSVSVFVLDSAADTLTPVQEFDTAEWPRDLKVYGDRLWIAGQVDNRVVTYVPDAAGTWQPDFEFPAPSPACILLVR